MGQIPESVIEAVRERADLLEVVGERTKLKRTGRTFRGPCPLHGGEGPNFVVDPAQGWFKCHVCGEGGDVFKFVMLTSGADFRTAVVVLAERSGVEIPADEPQGEKREDPHEHLYQLNDLALRWFVSHLTEGSAAWTYMVEERGFTPELLREMEIGYAPDGWTGLCDYASSRSATCAAASWRSLAG